MEINMPAYRAPSGPQNIYKPTTEEINSIITSTIPENTQKATINGVETITNKEQLEKEMMEFILRIRQIKTQEEYAPSSLKKLSSLKDYNIACLYGAAYCFNHGVGGIDRNLNALVIPVPPDPDGFQGPVHDLR
ncbi:3363_t:CDS:2 [Gigaspora margarita]|uniref:3363_t:CDS:1 n=1 Tax=Gigaspora margarita TaxID=4874 RepID=A0ABN7VHI7_GIGMA|nr:3363_t:CDS:2 [Gigaspora margarita]